MISFSFLSLIAREVEFAERKQQSNKVQLHCGSTDILKLLADAPRSVFSSAVLTAIEIISKIYQGQKIQKPIVAEDISKGECINGNSKPKVTLTDITL